MECEWREVSIGSLCEGIYDGPHATPKRTNLGPVFLGISSLTRGRIDLTQSDHLSEEDFPRWTRRVLPRKDDLVFSYETRLGEVALIPEGLRCCLGRRMALMRLDQSKADPRFLLYAYLSPKFQDVIRSRTKHGSTVTRILLTEFGDFPISVPELEEQREIGSILGSLDDRIDLLTKKSESLEAIARAIFKSWFVDFDPVQAKAEGRELEGMDAATAALFPSALVQSPLGQLPEGWTTTTVAGLCTKIVNGGTPSRSNQEFWAGGDVAWFTTGELADSFLLRAKENINQEALHRSSVKILPKHSLLMAIYAAPTVGRLGITSQESAFNQACTGMVPHLHVGAWFLYETLFEGRKWFNNMANGAAQQNISKAIVESYPCILPDRAVLERFNELADSLFQSIEMKANQVMTLAELRDTLLPRLISGKLRIPHAKKLVEAAL